jgi:catechol 2,3-dioxygenase-like lactoylglutathione lyase family enzyme
VPENDTGVRLQHVSIAIPVSGAEEARAFYGGTLGLEERDVLPALDPERFIWFRLAGDQELHLMLLDEPPPDGPHFCIATDDLASLRSRIEAAGVATRDGTPIVGRPRFTCRDPFGNLVELAEVGG